jgi:hypothetical protein
MAETKTLKEIIRDGLIKDFNELYVEHFTTGWKMERIIIKGELRIMSFDNTIKTILAKVEGIESPYPNNTSPIFKESDITADAAFCQARKVILEALK